MKGLGVVLVVFAWSIICMTSDARRHPVHSLLKHQQYQHEKLQRIQREREAQGFKYPEPQWFTQDLDHFNTQDQRTWQQRFYVNETFFNPARGGPIFLQVGGEAAISAGYVIDFMMAYYGKTEGALLVALEHRFYGQSHPFPDMSTSNLAYLSSEQALADAAKFVSFLKSKYPTAKDVITFGGSYPGNLAAWFRIKYPHITKAAVASSAPVLAELDMIQYLDVVDESLAKLAGVICDKNIAEATAMIEKLLQSPSGKAVLQKAFSTCDPLNTDKDIATFMSNLMGNWMGVVQYNGETPTVPTIEDLCVIMEDNATSILDRYIKAANIFLPRSGCMDVSYSKYINALKNVSDWGSGVGIRQWTYQTCVEFGYFQSTDSDNQPFGNLVPLSYYTDQCKDIFGFTFLPRINDTNVEYGGKNPGGTNILFVNGSIDPWHSLSVLTNLSDSILAIYIEGTAHCANMLPAGPDDPPALAVAQKQIAKQIHEWLVQ